MDVFWYEGGIRPHTPNSLVKKGLKMPIDGVMFIGERGIILTDYSYGNPVLLDVRDGDKVTSSIKLPKVELIDQTSEMINAFKGGKRSRGSFENVQTVAEAICLGNLAIRVSDRLEWDNKNMTVKNLPKANEFVSRAYRKGWEL